MRGYRLNQNVYRARHDMSEPGLSVTVAESLAAARGDDPTDTEVRLTEHFDPDALDRLFAAGSSDAPSNGSGYVRLDVDGAEVRVHADGDILIEL